MLTILLRAWELSGWGGSSASFLQDGPPAEPRVFNLPSSPLAILGPHPLPQVPWTISFSHILTGPHAGIPALLCLWETFPALSAGPADAPSHQPRSFLGGPCPSLDCEFCRALSLGFNCCLQLPSECSLLKILGGWCPGSAAGGRDLRCGVRALTF